MARQSATGPRIEPSSPGSTTSIRLSVPFRPEHADIGHEEGTAMPVCGLPNNPNLARLKATAKDLRDLVRAGIDGAIDTVREHHPRYGSLVAGSVEATSFKLADAQLTLARHHGFASWPKLVALLDAVSEFARSPHEQLGDGTARDGDELIRLACMNYGNDSASRPAAALALWRSNPTLAASSVFAAAAVGDHAVVSSFVAADRRAASAEGGPFAWPPLLYASYSRVVTGDPAHDFGETAHVLLAAGADPNVGFLWSGLLTPFTALTGAIGRGEQGSPPHAAQAELMRVLLAAGADPNDGQAIYNAGIGNAQPHDDIDWLQLLFAAGFGRPANGPSRGPWYRRLGSQLAEPSALVAELLHDAARRGFVERARLLLEHGADPNLCGDHPIFDGRSPYQDAVTRGYPELAAMLVAAGARTGSVTPVEQSIGRLLAGEPVDATQAAVARTHRPDLVRVAAKLGKSVAVLRHLVTAGWDVNAKNATTALHEAAGHGDLQLVEALVALGADPSVNDDGFDATPAGWADHFGHIAIRDYLNTVGLPERGLG